MVIGFFELRLFAFTRFPLWLTPELLSENAGVKLVLFYEQDDVEDKNKILKLFPVGTKLIKVDKINKSSIIGHIERESIERLVVMAQRIPDSCFVAAANKLGIKTFMYQHGLYVPFMKREKSLFINNIRKSLRFLQYAFTTADLVGVNKVNIIMQYLKIYLSGEKPLDTNIPLHAINTSKVLVYGEYWKKYHSEQFGYSHKQQTTVGAPDFNDLSSIKKNSLDTKSYDVCYIAQTLVEDGRLPRELMEQFILNLAKLVKTLKVNLFIRLHPRSDLSLYKPLEEIAEFSKSVFPKAQVYLGHYSSIIAKATFFSDKIVLVDFPNHEIPFYINMLNYDRAEFNDSEGLLEIIKRAHSEGACIDKIEKNIKKQDNYFDSKIVYPLRAAAIEVIKG